MKNQNKINQTINQITNHKHWGISLLVGLSLLVLAGSVLVFNFKSASAQVPSGIPEQSFEAGNTNGNVVVLSPGSGEYWPDHGTVIRFDNSYVTGTEYHDGSLWAGVANYQSGVWEWYKITPADYQILYDVNGHSEYVWNVGKYYQSGDTSNPTGEIGEAGRVIVVVYDEGLDGNGDDTAWSGLFVLDDDINGPAPRVYYVNPNVFAISPGYDQTGYIVGKTFLETDYFLSVIENNTIKTIASATKIDNSDAPAYLGIEPDFGVLEFTIKDEDSNLVANYNVFTVSTYPTNGIAHFFSNPVLHGYDVTADNISFTNVAPISLVEPNGTNSFSIGDTIPISWSIADYVDVSNIGVDAVLRYYDKTSGSYVGGIKLINDIPINSSNRLPDSFDWLVGYEKNGPENTWSPILLPSGTSWYDYNYSIVATLYDYGQNNKWYPSPTDISDSFLIQLSSDNLVEVLSPATGDTWYVGENKDVAFSLTRELTDSINIDFVLCQAEPGLCWDGEWLEPMIINPADGLGPFMATWEVGTKLDGTPISDIGTAGFVDNALISLYATGDDAGLSGRNYDSGVFSIEEAEDIPTVLIAVQDPNAADIYSNAWVLDTNETINFSVSEPILTDTQFAIYLGVKKPPLISWLDKISSNWTSQIKKIEAFTLIELLVTQLIIKMDMLQMEFIDYNMVPIGYIDVTMDGATVDYQYDWLVGDVIDAEGSTTNADNLVSWLVDPYNDAKIFVSALDGDYNLASSDEFQIALEASQGLSGTYYSADIQLTQPIESFTSADINWGFDEGYLPDPMLVGGGNIDVAIAFKDTGGNYINLDVPNESDPFHLIYTNVPISPEYYNISRLNAVSNISEAVWVQFEVMLATPDWNITRPYFESASITYDSVSDLNFGFVAVNFEATTQVGAESTPRENPNFILYIYEFDNPDVYTHLDSYSVADSFVSYVDGKYQGSIYVPIYSESAPEIPGLKPERTYVTFIKTPQHLSVKANETIDTPSGDTTVIGDEFYDLTFPELKAGDIVGIDPFGGLFGNRDDYITSTDYGLFGDLFGDDVVEGIMLLSDFNNDGSVNAHDAWPFKKQVDNGNYWKRGDLAEILGQPLPTE